MGPKTDPRPPVRLTPPSTTAATEFSRNVVLAAGSDAPTRAISRIAAMPARTPEIVYTAILMRAVLIPVAWAASLEPPVAKRCVPKRVLNRTTWARIARMAATMNGFPKISTPCVEKLISSMLVMEMGLPSESTSARPEATESDPRVTMKSVIFPFAMSTPFRTPMIVLATMAEIMLTSRPAPWA